MEELNRRPKKALVTGGSGFIGRALVDSLALSGWTVLSYDYNDALPQGGRLDGVHTIKANILDYSELCKHAKDVDIVFHLAAISSVPECSRNPAFAFQTNVMGTVGVLEAVRTHAPNATVVFASSAHVYGAGERQTFFNEDHSIAPASVYGASKAAAEAIAQQYQRGHGLDIRILRFSNVYGPQQLCNVIFDFHRKASKAESIFLIEGSGSQQRDFIYISDTIHAIIEIANHQSPAFQVYNVASGEVTSIRYLAELVCKLMNRENLTIQTTQSSWVGDIDLIGCDNSRLRTFFDTPFIDIDRGVGLYIDWVSSRTVGSNG